MTLTRLLRFLLVTTALAAGCSPGAQPIPDGADADLEPGSLPEPAVGESFFGPMEGEMGTENPISVQVVAPDGRWIVACQARADTNGDGEVSVQLGHHGDVYGDAFEPYFFGGLGAGSAIDEFVAADPSGRYVALVQPMEGLQVLDTIDGSELELPDDADVVDDPNPFGSHRAVSFDSAGTKMMYMRSSSSELESPRTLVVRDLTTGEESTFPLTDAIVVQAWVTPDGLHIVAIVVRDDSDGNGELDYPMIQTSLQGKRCGGPTLSYSTGGIVGDEPILELIDIATGVPAVLPLEALENAEYGNASLTAHYRGEFISVGSWQLTWDLEGGAFGLGPMRWVPTGI